MNESIFTITGIVRFLAGFILTIMAFRAFRGTRNSAMLYLTIGFAFITVGNLFSSLYYIEDLRMDKLLSNVFDIIGLITLIIAIIKS